MDTVDKIATTILYEGYLLWPYRRSTRKNQQRWTFGGVYPRAYSEASGSHDPWCIQTQCLVVGEAPSVTVTVRFLQVIERQVGRTNAAGRLDFVDVLQVGPEHYLAWEEAAERTITLADLQLAALDVPRRMPIALLAGSAEEPLRAPSHDVLGALVRRWQALAGVLEVSAVAVQSGVFQLTVQITNTTPWNGQDRPGILKQTFASTHVVCHVQDGEFVSLQDPPEALQQIAAACDNRHLWPVLVGEEDERHMLLAAPIILYDYPRIAPESPGDLFDGTEIDQLLLLNILTLTEAEKAEMRAADPRAREILERAESLTAEDFMHLHGAIREFHPVGERVESAPGWEALERPAPQSVTVQGTALTRGSKVRLRPHPRGDIFDLALAGKVAIVEAIEQDYEDRIQLAVTLEEDPGRDLGVARQPGHLFFFAPDEVDPLPSPSGGSHHAATRK